MTRTEKYTGLTDEKIEAILRDDERANVKPAKQEQFGVSMVELKGTIGPE